MNPASRASTLGTGTDLPQEIVELGQAIAILPPDRRALFEPIFQRVSESARRRRHILALVQEALSQLRLDMKYLLFDVEATRRERDALQRQLEETNGGI